METEGLNASQIVANAFIPSSSWHFGQARAWLDLAKRQDSPGPIHYAAIELRYGIEYLLFELLVISCESLTECEYQKCLGKPDAMKRMLKSEQIGYEKLSEFTKVVLGLDGTAPRTTHWDLGEIFRLWGIASERLHFCGSHADTYDQPNWKIGAIARLETAIDLIWKEITSTQGIAIMRPSGMTPATRGIWDDFSAGRIDRNQVAVRLELVRPVSIRQKQR